MHFNFYPSIGQRRERLDTLKASFPLCRLHFPKKPHKRVSLLILAERQEFSEYLDCLDISVQIH